MSELISVELSAELPELGLRLGQLYLKKELTDVTISCPNGELMAHKLILSAVSYYFRTQFIKSNKSHNSVLIFADICVEDIKTIVDIIYFGKQLIPNNRSENLIKIAKRFGINLISSNKFGDKRRPNCNQINNIVNSMTVRPAHQNSFTKSGQQFDEQIDKLVINEAENDISFEEFYDESPLDLSTIEDKNKTLEKMSTNPVKRRQRKQSDPKPNRKVAKYEEIFDISAKPTIEEPNATVKAVLDEITADYNNKGSQKTVDELPNLIDSYLNPSQIDIPINTANADDLENGNEFVVIDECPKDSVKRVNKEPLKLTHCCICDLNFTTEKRLLAHLKKEHKTDDHFECQFCNEKFKWGKKFANHSIACKIKYNLKH